MGFNVSYKEKRNRLALVVILTGLSLFLALFFGAADIESHDIFDCLLGQCGELEKTILWEFRLPRVLTGFFAGMGLSVAGVALQNTTRNPLAEPYLLGIVSGAGLGAICAQLVFPQWMSIALPVSAFLGALLSVFLVLLIGKASSRMEYIILIGVAISFMLSALGQLILYVSEPFASNRIIFWLMGSLADVELSQLAVIAPIVLISSVVVMSQSRSLDALLLSDENARLLGVDVERLKLLMFVISAILTAIIVAHCGGIGFVGLMVPHIMRLWLGSRSSALVIFSGLVGGGFLVWVDVFARQLLPQQEIPVGVVTSFLGGVFFLYMLITQKIK